MSLFSFFTEDLRLVLSNMFSSCECTSEPQTPVKNYMYASYNVIDFSVTKGIFLLSVSNVCISSRSFFPLFFNSYRN